MTPRLPLIAAALVMCAGCENKPVDAAPEAATPGKTDEPAEVAAEALAEPAETPKGLEKLELSKSQAAKINQWLERQGEHVDPSDFAKLVESVLRPDQLAEFHKIIEAGGG